MSRDDTEETVPSFGEATVAKVSVELENYRRGRCDESDAISAICELIYMEGPGAGIDASKCREACKSYIENIRNITKDLQRREAVPPRAHGTGTDSRDDDERDDGINRDGNRDPFATTPGANEDPVRREAERRLRRSRDEMEDEGESDERPSKRSFNEDLLPFVSSSSPFSDLPAALVKTNLLKSNYRADLPTSLQRLHDAVHLPQFPRPLWKDILQGHYVDFDKLLSTTRSITGDATESKKLGEFEVHSDTVKITRRVTDKLEWVEAYTMYADAVKFAFPCREKELIAYGASITKLFTGTASRFHCTILDYDRAVRTRAGRSNDFQLTDTAEFDDLARAHMSPIGVAAQSTFGYQSRILPPSKAPRLPHVPTSGEICNRFNQGRKHDRCPFKHACKVCGDSTHGECDCPSRTANPPRN